MSKKTDKTPRTLAEFTSSRGRVVVRYDPTRKPGGRYLLETFDPDGKLLSGMSNDHGRVWVCFAELIADTYGFVVAKPMTLGDVFGPRLREVPKEDKS